MMTTMMMIIILLLLVLGYYCLHPVYILKTAIGLLQATLLNELIHPGPKTNTPKL